MSLSALAGLVLALALIIALHFRLSGLPPALWALARKERAQDGGSLLDAMKEAVATRSGQAVIAVQTYHEQLAHSLRGQIAEAEMRARVAERRAADTVTALDAASAVLRELRTALEAATDVTRELRAFRDLQKRSETPRSPPTPTALPTRPPSRAAPAELSEPDDADRKTAEMPSSVAPPGRAAPADPESARETRVVSPPPADTKETGFDDEDEKTRVADRTGALAAFRLARRAPTLLPPAPTGGEVPR